MVNDSELDNYYPEYKKQNNFNKFSAHQYDNTLFMNKNSTPKESAIINRIVNISKLNLHDAAFLSVLYLTGSRLEEVTKYNYNKYGIVINRPGIVLEDIYAETEPNEETGEEEQWITIKTRVLKIFKSKKDMSVDEREEILTKNHYKYAILPYQESSPWFPLIRIIEIYLELFEGKPGNTELFNYGSRNWRNKTHRYFGVHPHQIRHWRSKILVREHGFTPQDLKEYIGWHSDAMPMFYSKSEKKEIKRKLYKPQNTL